MMSKCPICQRTYFSGKDLKYRIIFKDYLDGMRTESYCCEKCYKSIGVKGLVNLAKQTDKVNWKDLEDLGLIKKYKGDVVKDE